MDSALNKRMMKLVRKRTLDLKQIFKSLQPHTSF